MSKRIMRCPKCGEKTNISAFSNNPDILLCCACNFKGNRGAFETFIPTVFDSITASQEVLAEKLVYNKMYMIQDGVLQYWVSSYYSTIIKGKSWEYETEAIAATVEKLKEVKNG